MAFPVNAALLDALVLAVVSKEDTYGYKITQDIRIAVDVSESTLYPVLRRLQKENNLETYDREFQGRNRRYYRITDKGKAALELYREDWKLHRTKIESILIIKDSKVLSENYGTHISENTMLLQGEETVTNE